MRFMNDLVHGQLSNPNRPLKLVLIGGEFIRNTFFSISTTLANDLITSHSLSQYSLISTVKDLILTTQSPMRS